MMGESNTAPSACANLIFQNFLCIVRWHRSNLFQLYIWLGSHTKTMSTSLRRRDIREKCLNRFCLYKSKIPAVDRGSDILGNEMLARTCEQDSASLKMLFFARISTEMICFHNNYP